MFVVLYLVYEKSWLVVPIVSLLIGIYSLLLKRDNYHFQAYVITIFACINITLYAIMTNEFTEVFTVLCAAACMISFYHMPKMNYILVGYTTLFVLYELIFQGEWQAFLETESSIVIVVYF